MQRELLNRALFFFLQTHPKLLCTVRQCHQPLTREANRLLCPSAHSFDIARTGYINLLQPQDRRSKLPGDTRAAIAGRRSIHDEGFTRPLFDAIAETLHVTTSDTVLDIGTGDGFYLGGLARQSNCRAHGLDISMAAIEHAARRYPNCEWIVANADRFIPYSDHSFSIVLSITARMNPSEFERVLAPNGRLLIALPASDDLIELRGTGRTDRVPRTIQTFSEHFALLNQSRVTTSAALDSQAIEGLLHSIYRPLQSTSPKATPPKIIPPKPTEITLSLDLLLFKIRAS